MSTHRLIALAAALAAASLMSAVGCSATPEEPDSDSLVGAPEDVVTKGEGVSGSLAVGSTLVSTTDVNHRTGPSTSYKILHVVPQGSKVTVVESSPKNGFYKIKHNGTIGWSYGQYYKPAASSSPSSTKRDAAIARAQSGMGFSYWWGHARFRPEGPTASNKGTCSGSCPNCSHSGSYGGDCSGLVGKVWQVGSNNDSLTTDSHPYSTASFVHDTSQWSTVSRSNLKKADAMVYNSNGAGHIFVYEKGDGWGQMYAYECKGCSYGCVHDLRSASSAYHGIRRAGY
jgi:uncharacterized protein YgiM (DUF1202 family)